jgi:adenine phosphoribosyltransferase
MAVDPDDVKGAIRDIPDWPSPGVTFRDITPLLNDVETFAAVVDSIVAHVEGAPIARVLGVEARGFIFAAPVAYRLGAGLVPIRKAGKLPWAIEQEEYALVYGTDLLEIHIDGIDPSDEVLVVDDVLATGGTASAACSLLESAGAVVTAVVVLIEITDLGGRSLLGSRDLHAVLSR